MVDDKCTNKKCKYIASTKSSSSTKKRAAEKKTVAEGKNLKLNVQEELQNV